jgi:hypothetical protein|tara:strand:+ start:400 stop:1077 length:678 start_codon:yes stop_codon:yes gene_type:complete
MTRFFNQKQKGQNMNIKIIGTFVATALFAGSLNVAEAEEAKKTSRSSREAIMKRFDKDGDGKLNETERKAAAAALRKQSGSESDRGRQRIETARRQISAAMKAGEITEKQGKERMAALKKRISQSQSGSGNNRAKSDNDRSRRGSDYRARLMKEFDKNGDGKLDKAEREAARKGPSSRRGKGGGERSARGRDNRRADRTAESRTRGQGGEKAERRRRSDRRGKKD